PILRASTHPTRRPSLPHPTLFFLPRPPPTHIYTLSLHDALPILTAVYTAETGNLIGGVIEGPIIGLSTIAENLILLRYVEIRSRSEEHTSELQSRFDLVCRLLLEKKKRREHVQRPSMLVRVVLTT